MKRHRIKCGRDMKINNESVGCWRAGVEVGPRDHTGEGTYLSPEVAGKPGDGIPSMNEQSSTRSRIPGAQGMCKRATGDDVVWFKAS